MRQHAITDETWTEAEAMQLLRGLGYAPPRRRDTGSSDAKTALSKPRPADQRAILARTFAEAVIPQLLRSLPPAATCAITTDITAVANLAMRASQAETIAYVEKLQADGHAIESLMLDLLAPAARHLGQLWEDDLCDFSEVTLGLVRLGHVLRLLGRAFAEPADRAALGTRSPSILLVQMPGEQHGFGLAMVVQFFQRAGWRVRQAPAISHDGLIRLVSTENFDLVGLSTSSAERMEDLAHAIGAIRRHARNPAIAIMVGGPPFTAKPELADLIGADATARDASHAVQQASALLRLPAGES